MGVAIRTRQLSNKLSRLDRIAGLDLDVPLQSVFGYLGPNGPGKTTAIRLLAGLIRSRAGRAEVLGLDSVADREAVQRRIGYLPGDFVAYPDLTAAQYLRYLASLRGGVDWSDVEHLAQRFDLDLDLGPRIGTLSRNQQKIGIVQAFMHSPELLILDEPIAGLDPIMQREFLALVRERRSQAAGSFSHLVGGRGGSRHRGYPARRAVGGDPVRGRIAGSGGSKNGPHLREQRAGRAAAPDGRRTRSLGRRSHGHVAVEGSTSELLKVAAVSGALSMLLGIEYGALG